MLLSKIAISILLGSLTIAIHAASYLESASALPRLATKQDPQNIVYLSQDGVWTYYQKRPGSLMLAGQFQIKEVLKGPQDSYFGAVGSTANKRLILIMDPFITNNQDTNHESFLFWIPFGGTETRPLGRGVDPNLHLDDSWVSYYRTYQKTIQFQSIDTNSSFQIKLNNPLNPYFIPQVIMLSEQEIIYTDINDKGITALLRVNRQSNKTTVLMSQITPGMRIELCAHNNNLFIGEFPYPDIKASSSIRILPITTPLNLGKMKIIYQSNNSDLGHMECHSSKNKLYFLQTQASKNNISPQIIELAALDLTTQKVNTLSNFRYVTQIINVGGRIMIPFDGNFYVVEETKSIISDKLNDKELDLIKIHERINGNTNENP